MGTENKKRFVIKNYGKLEDLDRSFDLQYWQAQPSAARFTAAWEMVEFAHQLKGKPARELRLQRSVENFQRISG